MPLILAIAAFGAVAILWIVSDRRASQRIYDRYSVLHTGDDGLSLAYGYLAKQRKVAMLTRPLARVQIEPNAVVFRVVDELPVLFDPGDLEKNQVGPPRPRFTPLLNDAEEAFVRRGGRMVLLASHNSLAPELLEERRLAKKVFPIWPSVGDVKMCETCPALGFRTLRPRMHALFTANELVIAARERIGGGELYIVATPEIFKNDELAGGNHLALLAALAGTNRPLYFDEVIHGIMSGDGALALMKEWNLGPFLLMLAAVALLIFWRAGRRVGPPEEDYRETRSDAVDLVRSLGALYRQVTSEAAAIALYHEALTRTVASQSGLRGDALRKRVDELTGHLVPPQKFEDIPESTFKRQLDAINEAFRRLANAKRGS